MLVEALVLVNTADCSDQGTERDLEGSASAVVYGAFLAPNFRWPSLPGTSEPRRAKLLIPHADQIRIYYFGHRGMVA